MARSFQLLVAATDRPALLPHDPFLHLSAGTLALAVANGRLDLTATTLTALGHARGPGDGPGAGTASLKKLALRWPAVFQCIDTDSPLPMALR